MQTPFEDTLRAIDAPSDSFLRARTMLWTLLAVAWTAWFLGAEIEEEVPSTSARVVARGKVHQVASSVDSATVRQVFVEMGDAVERGDVLVQLDDRGPRLEIERARAELRSAAGSLDALRRQRAALVAEHELSPLEAGQEARAVEARQRQAESRLAMAQETLRRSRGLRAAGLVSAAELDRATAEVEIARADVEHEVASLAGIAVSGRGKSRRLLADIAELDAAIARTEGRRQAQRAELTRLDHELERHRLRSPVRGRVGTEVQLDAGTVVAAGVPLLAVVPAGVVVVVAQLDADRATGRIRPGQAARVMLEAFPAARFGALPGVVHRLASEISGGTVTAEIRLASDLAPPIPLTHGMPARVSVRLGARSPAASVLDNLGRALPRGQAP